MWCVVVCFGFGWKMLSSSQQKRAEDVLCNCTSLRIAVITRVWVEIRKLQSYIGPKEDNILFGTWLSAVLKAWGHIHIIIPHLKWKVHSLTFPRSVTKTTQWIRHAAKVLEIIDFLSVKTLQRCDDEDKSFLKMKYQLFHRRHPTLCYRRNSFNP